MSFGEVFAEHRSTRNVKPKELKQVGVLYYDIKAYEKNGTLPGIEKLDTILTFMGKVAVEQGADGMDEIRELHAAWWESHFDRLGMDPDLTPTIAAFVVLDPERQEAALQAMKQAVGDLTKH
jgi:hypothetical protein